MNILVIGKYDQDSFASHISQTLKVMGHSTSEYEMGIKYKRYQSRFLRNVESAKKFVYNLSKDFEKGRKNEVNKISNAFKSKIDLIISTSDFLYPEQVSTLKNHYKCNIVMWYPDAMVNLKKSLFLTADYDCVFFKEPYFVKVLRNEYNVKNAFYLPECFNPIVHKLPKDEVEFEQKYISDITTAGNLHPYRVKFFSELKGYNIKIWGNPAPKWVNSDGLKKYFQKQYIENEIKAFVFHNSKIVLNNLHPGEVWGINVRAFEIAGCGGFQLINWRPGIKQLFKENEEIVAFHNFDELKEKIDYYLSNDEDRKIITEKSYLRAHRDHTYALRLELLLKTIFENGKGFELPLIDYA